MKIRQAELSDAADLSHLADVLDHSYPEEKILANLERLLLKEEHILFLAEEEGKVIGFIEAELYEAIYGDPMLNVLGLVVDTEAQGKGTGAKLLSALEKEALLRGILEIRLNSGSQRLEAHKFYEKQGYVGDHTQRRFFKSLENSKKSSVFRSRV